ncbi:hypothetical protein B0E53_07065 [Micromonospora sp. MH33]|nr:hypothetical protein B0E53_07065 [Micromonospora sp. MH33]
MCTTAVSPGSSSTRSATATASLTSQATTRAAPSSSTSSAAPGASGPRREASTTSAAPLASNQRATCRPSAPVPPVTSTVPRGRHPAPAGGDAGTRRRANTPLRRTATWSWAPSARTATSAARVPRSARVGRSIRPPHRSGRSRATTRPRPQASADQTSPPRSPGETGRAVRLSAHTRPGRPVSMSAWVRVSSAAAPAGRAGACASGRSWRGRTQSTPAQPWSLIRRSRSPSSRRPWPEGTVTVSTRAPASASVFAMPASAPPLTVATSQRPDNPGTGAGRTGSHPIRYDQSSSAAPRLRARRQVDRTGRAGVRASTAVSSPSWVARAVRSPLSTAAQNSASGPACTRGAGSGQ